MPPDPAADFKSFEDDVFQSIQSVVRCTGVLAATDIDFHRSSDPSFADAVDRTSAQILSVTSSILHAAAAGSDLDIPDLTDHDSKEEGAGLAVLEERWRDIVDIADFLLERADTCLDEYTGAIKQKNPTPLPGARILERAPRLARSTSQRPNVNFSANSWTGRNMKKPQLEFARKPDNLNDSPFRPLLTVKPYAIVPLEESFTMRVNEETGREIYDHPYRKEIEEMKYPNELFEKREPIMYLPFDETAAVWVDTLPALAAMLQELKRETEIAVDLEHHNARSYRGFVCLMQISTRKKDWIVDTLKLREELQILNEVFADPKIIKALHGAYMDIIWLQRDFGLYVVGLFDTYFAAKYLGLQAHSLAFLLKKYVDFDADKQYQLADWRLRPLPGEMLNYARSDTHFLLYCFDHLRNELIAQSKPGNPDYDKMAFVLQGSKEVALRQYEREPYDLEGGSGAHGWRSILGRINDSLDVRQTEVFKAVHQFCDRIARETDEGHHYVMPRSQLFMLARTMPEDVQGITDCCTTLSPPLKSRLSALASVIAKAKNNLTVQEWRVSLKRAEQEASKPKPVATTTPRVFELDASVIRAAASGFWGTCAKSSKWHPLRDLRLDISMAVPLPELSAAVFASTNEREIRDERAQLKSVDPGARAEHEYVKSRPTLADEPDNVMIVRQVGGGVNRKRRHDEFIGDGSNTRPDSLQPPAPPSRQEGEDLLPLPTDLNENSDKRRRVEWERPGKAAKKAARKAAKKAAKKAAIKQEKGKEGNGKPFDYRNAPPVLNANAGQTKKEVRERKKQLKIFEPYQQAPGGVPRGQQERAGRTMTFKK